jgi:hypothetical protein
MSILIKSSRVVGFRPASLYLVTDFAPDFRPEGVFGLRSINFKSLLRTSGKYLDPLEYQTLFALYFPVSENGKRIENGFNSW